MKELSKLAVLCAQRMDLLLQIYDGFVCVYVGFGPERNSMVAKCDDESAVAAIFQELATGKYKNTANIIRYGCVA